ncbi:uncharacterized protein LOC122497984 [Leptopilina heterotoma]|uniref:uncharacterized protein LOC122497984 n=1 Tax=Leptopilina heterotoma TaxID=63436 RepID=UPI001CA87D9A|nr:uncharacterized protein LOC122497984 [Leptopilina heterotoma]
MCAVLHCAALSETQFAGCVVCRHWLALVRLGYQKLWVADEEREREIKEEKQQVRYFLLENCRIINSTLRQFVIHNFLDEDYLYVVHFENFITCCRIINSTLCQFWNLQLVLSKFFGAPSQ